MDTFGFVWAKIRGKLLSSVDSPFELVLYSISNYAWFLFIFRKYLELDSELQNSGWWSFQYP